jgi:phosphoribosylformylglycinamidine synthase subunit PurS
MLDMSIVTDITECLGHKPGPWSVVLPGQAAGGTLPLVSRVVVEVMLKPEIHDPQGEAIASACHRLGFGQVVGVRQGKRFEVELSEPADETALARVAELASELLANPVMEEFSVRLA